MRFLDKFLREYNDDVLRDGPNGMTRELFDRGEIVAAVTRPDTQRLLFDHSASRLLLNSPPPPQDMELHWPFDRQWCEFEQGIRIIGPAIPLYVRGVLMCPEGEKALLGVVPDRMKGLLANAGNANCLVMIQKDDGTLMPTPISWSRRDGTTATMQEIEDIGGHYVRLLEDLGQYLRRLCAYTMARGVEIVEEPLSRQQRKRLMAQRGIPSEWHLVRVRPRVSSAASPVDDDDPGSHHGFRYDVAGHLRFGRHKLGDGSYRHNVEWVRPHQRGLQHKRYIPSTRRYGSGHPLPPSVE